MDDEIESLMIGVRADTAGFGREVTAMRTTLTEGLGGGAERAGRDIETALAKAATRGKLGFADLEAAALKALDDIAFAAVKGGISSLFDTVGTGLLSGLFGLPGRATGGAVSPGAAYVVGERGPEMFVPTSAGSVAPMAAGRGSQVNVAIAITAPAGSDEPQALARSSRQVARAVARALGAG